MKTWNKFRITCYSRADFHVKLQILFDRGFVFTTGRVKTLDEMRKLYGCEYYWWYIVIGANDECSKVLSATNFGYDIDSIRIEEALILNY